MEVNVCLFGSEVTQKSHKLQLARESDAAEAGDLVTALGVARLNQHNSMLSVHACHT
jgi:hypothetical protein